MPIRRAYMDPPLEKGVGGFLTLPKEVAHRFVDVLRLGEGALVELFDGQGNVLRGILSLGPPARMTNLAHARYQRELPAMVVAQAMVKMDKLEQVVQRATELAASQIVLFDCERSQVRLGDKVEKKMSRLMRIAQDAARQCGRADVPEIHGPLRFEELLHRCRSFDGLCVLGEPDTDVQLLSLLEGEARGIMILVGPEGGFSPAEVRALKQSGAREANWAEHLLRTETAALAALSVIQQFYRAGRAFD